MPTNIATNTPTNMTPSTALNTCKSSVDTPGLRTLSPSRASDFMTCPQLYKFKAIDRIPTSPTVQQARGTAIHLALEKLFHDPAPDRTPDRLYDLFRESWSELKPIKYPDLFDSVEEERSWGIEGLNMLAAYFSIEDPTSFNPLENEMDLLVDIDHMKIRGILDRMEEIEEIGPDGQMRTALVITDYKTGKAPSQRYANNAFFGLKVYALLIRASRGVTPDRIRLLYLKGPTQLTMDVTDTLLDAMQRQLASLWEAIESAIAQDRWPTKTSALCNWCDFKDTICPAWENERNEEERVAKAEPDD